MIKLPEAQFFEIDDYEIDNAPPMPSSFYRFIEKSTEEQAGFLFVHFLRGCIQTSAPHNDNVTDDHGYSRLLADFPSVGGGIILTVRFLEKGPF